MKRSTGINLLLSLALTATSLSSVAQERARDHAQVDRDPQVDRDRSYDRDRTQDRDRVDTPDRDRDRLHDPDFLQLRDRDIYGYQLMSVHPETPLLRHCEEQRDVAIPRFKRNSRLPRYARNDGLLVFGCILTSAKVS